jgi:hypothetical protein
LKILTLIFVCLLLASCSSLPIEEVVPNYFDQIPPGDVPIVFAPGIVSTEEGIEFSASFSPDGKEFFFSRRQPGADNQLYYARFEEGEWGAPVLSPVSSTFGESEAIISPDGERLFFMSRRPVPEDVDTEAAINYWVSTSSQAGWSVAEYLGANMMYVTEANSGTIYFTEVAGSGVRQFIASQALVDGEYGERLAVDYPGADNGHNGHPFIAPDESYMIFDRGNDDLYIVYKVDNGGWSEPLKLNDAINTAADEIIGMVTTDGNYFFFTRFENGSSDIYWVSASFIEEMRPEALD